MNLEIANRLARLRRENHLSQEELAAQIGISRQAVSKWERAESSPDTDNLILLARLYRVSLDELLKTDEPVEAAASPAAEGQPLRPAPEPLDEAQGQNAFQRFPYYVLVVTIYLGMGYFFDAWSRGWPLFLTIPLYYWIAGELQHWRQKK